MKYCVTMRVEGRFTCEVEAESIKEAKMKASQKYYDSDFGVLEYIDADFIEVEGDNENHHNFD